MNVLAIILLTSAIFMVIASMLGLLYFLYMYSRYLHWCRRNKLKQEIKAELRAELKSKHKLAKAD